MQFVAASAKVAGHFTAEEGKNFVEMVGRRNTRIHNYFELRIDMPALFEKAEGEARAYAERILAINAAARKHQFNFLSRGAFARDVGEKYRACEHFSGAFFALASDAQRERRPSLLFVAQLEFS